MEQIAGYCTVGIVIPLINGKRGSKDGMILRNKLGELNSLVLDSLRGVDETIQYGQGDNQIQKMNKKSIELGTLQKSLSKREGKSRGLTNFAILVFSFAMLFLSISLMNRGIVDFAAVVTMTVAMMGSFGPVVALANLSNNLNQTLACGERVLSLLEEEPLVEEIAGVDKINEFTGAKTANITFAYEDETILKDYSIDLQPGKIIGIHGRSGSGKSNFFIIVRFSIVKYFLTNH